MPRFERAISSGQLPRFCAANLNIAAPVDIFCRLVRVAAALSRLRLKAQRMPKHVLNRPVEHPPMRFAAAGQPL